MQPGEKLRKPRWEMDRLAPFEKNFYKPHPNLTVIASMILVSCDFDAYLSLAPLSDQIVA